jgi:antitoxin (DNA-binding transcriptional repressor) of toxin-antitoxin stability system
VEKPAFRVPTMPHRIHCPAAGPQRHSSLLLIAWAFIYAYIMTISRQYAMDHFDEICERAEAGEVIVLERPGKSGLMLVPQTLEGSGSSLEAVEGMREFIRSRPVERGQIDYRSLMEEGHRY